MENFDPEMLFRPSKEKLEAREQILNETIVSLGISDGQSVLHFGCHSDEGTLSHLTNVKKIKYTGVDVNTDEDKSVSTQNLDTTIIKNDMQTFLELSIEENKNYDWVVISEMFNKDLYSDDQYSFVDSILRTCLLISNHGIIFTFNTEKTLSNEEYNIHFIIAYITSIYSRFNIIRLNEKSFVICIYKYFC